MHDVEFTLRDIGMYIRKNKGLVFSAEIEQNFKAEIEYKRILTKTEITFLIDDPDEPGEKIIAVHYVNMTVIKHDNIELVTKEVEGGQAEPDPDFLEFLSNNVLATVRGILLEKLSNSPARSMILPLVSDAYRV
ncbi:hypothetical protein [Fibrella aestuarina]|uniref:hypothetical protein n=1 Tax=Fibrella aestuarina TaxID=651143 RepID=UPI0011D1B120|nr:hypothetical protein [Fibrella aestuarina]